MHAIIELPGNVSHPPASAASQGGAPPQPTPEKGPRTFNGRPIKFSSETEGKLAKKAEADTGLVAREVFRPARKRRGVPALFPDDPRMRCQLGKIIQEYRHQQAVPKMRYEFVGWVDVFELQAYGGTWADAAAMAVRLGVTETGEGK